VHQDALAVAIHALASTAADPVAVVVVVMMMMKKMIVLGYLYFVVAQLAHLCQSGTG
jgi:hypothetical protein